MIPAAAFLSLLNADFSHRFSSQRFFFPPSPASVRTHARAELFNEKLLYLQFMSASTGSFVGIILRFFIRSFQLIRFVLLLTMLWRENKEESGEERR